jgi:hypothetical protein
MLVAEGIAKKKSDNEGKSKMNHNESKTAETTLSFHGLPPELEAAADALVGTHFYERELGDDGDVHMRGGGLTNPNEACIYLMQRGLKPVLAMVKEACKEDEFRHQEYRILMTVLQNNPHADSTSLELYDEGSPERMIFENAPFWKDDDGERMLTDVEFRAWTADELTCLQQSLTRLWAAWAALEVAIERGRGT